MTPRDRLIQEERLRRIREAESPTVVENGVQSETLGPFSAPAKEPEPARKVPLAVPVEPKVKK